MSDDFYEFEHECDKMPDGVRFYKVNGSASSQFAVDQSERCVVLYRTVFYGFRYCPYCGEDMEARDD